MPHVRKILPIAALAALSLAAPVGGAEEPDSSEREQLVEEILEARKETRYWQKVMQRKQKIPRVGARLLQTFSTASLERALANSRERTKRVRRAAKDPPHERQFRCIHRHEGAWDANTGNGYYGGLQMDSSFQRTYGRWLLRTKGRAHRWTPIEQIWVGERALREGRGFYPWPVAARRCGLI
jgi:hypothetical protein